MRNQRGFIQIPILIAIIAGFLVLGGAGYVGVKQYQNHQAQNPQTEIAKEGQSTSTPELSEVDKLKREVDDLKKQAASQKSPAPQTTPKSQPQQTATPISKKKVALSNADIIKHVKPATVFIETTEGAGSGMIIEADGYVLTNAHVVFGVSSARIKLSDGRSLTASVVGRDEVIDLAILKISETNLPKVELGNSDEVAQGDDVFTLGYPFGIEGDVSFKEGTISRKLTDSSGTYLETSAEIHPGNSGGPLVNKFGEVIGVNAMVLGRSIAGISVGETIKFAIPINTAKSIIPDLKSGKVVIDAANIKKAEYADFSTFKTALLDIISSALSGNDFFGDAEIQYANGNYFSASSKARDGIAVYNSAIQRLQNLAIPTLPFSDTIRELVQLYIRDYQYQVTLGTDSQYKYEAFLNVNGSYSSKLDYALYIDGERTKVMNERTNFYNNQFQPKFKEYKDKVDAYFQ